MPISLKDIKWVFYTGSLHSCPVLSYLTVTDSGVIVNTLVLENNLWVENWGVRRGRRSGRGEVTNCSPSSQAGIF